MNQRGGPIMPRTFDAMARALRGDTLPKRWHHTAVCMASTPSVGGSLPLYTIPRARLGAPGAPLASCVERRHGLTPVADYMRQVSGAAEPTQHGCSSGRGILPWGRDAPR